MDDIELQTRENDLILATHGRSIWILDDLTPLEKINASVPGSDLMFFDPRPATTWHLYQRRWSAGQKMFTAANPPYGALLNYYLKQAVTPEMPAAGREEKPNAAAGEQAQSVESKKQSQVKINVYDKNGQLLRALDGPGTAGVNRTHWDLRYEPVAEPTEEQREEMAAGYSLGPRGPLVEPGDYSIKITANGHEASQKVSVQEDPQVQISPEDRAARRAAIDQVYALAKTAAKDRKRIAALKVSVHAVLETWNSDARKPGAPKIPLDIQKSADELEKKVDALAEKFLRERQGLGNAGPPLEWKPAPLPQQAQDLLENLDEFLAAPSGQDQEKLAELAPLVADASAQVKKLIGEDLPAFNKKMNEAGIPHIPPPAEP